MTAKISVSKFVFLFLLSFTVFAEEATEKEAAQNETKDAEESQAIIEQVETASKQGSSDTAKTWIPSADKFDWIQLTSNEWLKGEVKGMYKDSLEFDSDKLDLLNIDWEDVKILRSHRTNNINIEGVGATSGVLEVTDDSMEIINDYENQTYDRSKLISFAPGGKKESDLWAIKATLGLDLRQGNTDQVDYTARVNIKRRGSTTRFLMDYIGNISKTNGGDGSLIETINNHRLNASYDYYKTRHFFYTPVFVEFFRDTFTNIALKSTLGAGLGYTVIDNGRTELSIAGGPAFVKTEFVSVAAGENTSESTPAAVLRTNYDYELSKTIDFIARYNIQVGNQASGGYTHHIILTFESEITGALDFDTSFIWDRTVHPTQAADGTTPLTNDYRITFGVSYTY
jgi:putative salt-induced outer membrane protein YdiY